MRDYIKFIRNGFLFSFLFYSYFLGASDYLDLNQYRLFVREENSFKTHLEGYCFQEMSYSHWPIAGFHGVEEHSAFVFSLENGTYWYMLKKDLPVDPKFEKGSEVFLDYQDGRYRIIFENDKQSYKVHLLSFNREKLNVSPPSLPTLLSKKTGYFFTEHFPYMVSIDIWKLSDGSKWVVKDYLEYKNYVHKGMEIIVSPKANTNYREWFFFANGDLVFGENVDCLHGIGKILCIQVEPYYGSNY